MFGNEIFLVGKHLLYRQGLPHFHTAKKHAIGFAFIVELQHVFLIGKCFE